MDAETFSLISVPVFTGVIGYVTNWTGILMLFFPISFKGFRLPGLAPLAHLLPRRVQQIPGIMQGGVGWQGIIPSRAAKMGSIAVDKGVAKIGGPSDFYQQLGPVEIAEHILSTARQDIHAIVDRTMSREHPRLWEELTPRMRQAVRERVEAQLPEVVRQVTDEIGDNIDSLLDVKLMVIRRISERPELSNRIFLEVGRRELRFIINFGFFFGFLLGIPTAFLTEVVWHEWWLLPLFGIVIGYVTNLVAIWMIFEPTEPHRVLGFRWQGLFLKRQKQAAAKYAEVISEDIITVANIGDELVNGPSADRTRMLIESTMRSTVDRAAGRVSPALRIAVGSSEYDAIRESVASEAVDYTMEPLRDEAFNRRQRRSIREMISTKMAEMPPSEFSEMLRTAMREDEWLLYLHGAVLGFIAGLIHLAIFG
ncbi:MAG: hypothetical protein H0W09_02605 [Solirubrobacterales bacterium]|nr:hypothetical protein [Solirubrobacterales bacterium]